MKVNEILSESDPKVKAYKVKIPTDSNIAEMDPKKAEDIIFGEEEGDESFVQNQDVVTIETIEVKDGYVYFYPFWDDKYSTSTLTQLQRRFQDWAYSDYVEGLST